MSRKEFLQRLGRNPASPMDIPWQWKYAKNEPYITQLSPADEAKFQQWVKANKVPFDPSITADYDMRGYWQGLQTGDEVARQSINPNDNRMHFPDKWKTPYHHSFSADSKYAVPGSGAPTWNPYDQLVLPNGRVVYDERADVRQQQLQRQWPQALRRQ